MTHRRMSKLFGCVFISIIATCLPSGEALQTLWPSNCYSIQDKPLRVVCACSNDTACDELKFDWPSQRGKAVHVQSSQSGYRFHMNDLCDGGSDHCQGTGSDQYAKASVYVNTQARYQTITGFGGGFSDAFGINANSLSDPVKEKLLASYFGENGLHYTIGRVPMGGTDFSTREYSYDDLNGDDPNIPDVDLNLTYWKLAPEDLAHKIPLMKRAVEMTASRNNSFKFLASPWNAPAWMRDTGLLNLRRKLKSDDRIYQSYANYWLRFLAAYKEHGIEFWGATVQNEPMTSAIIWEARFIMSMLPDEVIHFVVNFLGPSLRQAGYTKRNFKLLVGDDSLGMVNSHINRVLWDPAVHKYVSGFAYHWYFSGVFASYGSIEWLRDRYSNTCEFVLQTEAATGFGSFYVDFGSWLRGEAYVRDIIRDLKVKTNGWLDWNMALDMDGGPNHLGITVDSPILVDSSKDTFYKQPMYYALGHFSRFFRPGSVRVGMDIQDRRRWSNELEGVAVHLNETDHLAINLINLSHDHRTVDLYLDVFGSKDRFATVSLVPKSINTIIIKL